MEHKSCCHTDTKNHNHQSKNRFDVIMHGSLLVIVIALALHFTGVSWAPLHHFAQALIELGHTMWWGVALGLLSVGLMNKIPREYFTAVMGRGDTFGDIVKAAIAGVVLDLCNHGILVITGKLYERGLSLAQVLTFLISSPWNSLSLTFILIALIGLKWTLVFTLASMVIAIISGVVYQLLTRKGLLPANPHTVEMPENFNLKEDAKARLRDFKFSWKWLGSIATEGWHEGQMILRWILFGSVMAAALAAFVPEDFLGQWFGPTALGLLITLAVATVVEICSEGSAPIAAEIMNSAAAPGNGFAFLMAGVATDYTEILVVREFTGSWKIALSIPLITVPQIVILGILMNMAGL